MFSSTTFSSSRRSFRRAKPLGSQRAGQSESFSPPPPPWKIRLRAELQIVFSLQRRHKSFPPPAGAGGAPILLILVSIGHRDHTVAPGFACLRSVRLEQDARLRQQLRRALARAHVSNSSRSRSSPLSRTTYFLTAISFPATKSTPSPLRDDRDSEERHQINDAGD